jgi:hypothetical protein
MPPGVKIRAPLALGPAVGWASGLVRAGEGTCRVRGSAPIPPPLRGRACSAGRRRARRRQSQASGSAGRTGRTMAGGRTAPGDPAVRPATVVPRGSHTGGGRRRRSRPQPRPGHVGSGPRLGGGEPTALADGHLPPGVQASEPFEEPPDFRRHSGGRVCGGGRARGGGGTTGWSLDLRERGFGEELHP